MGTRLLTQNLLRNAQDHPHAYGDKLPPKSIGVLSKGSSPRVWGQVNGGENKSDVKGIIPTRMGTSIIRNGLNRFNEDHPHAYGDKCYHTPKLRL